MELVARKKLEIFVEGHALGWLEATLGEAGFKGWSVFAGVQGAGAHGSWRQTGIGETEALLVIAIGHPEAADTVLAALKVYFDTYPGVVAVSDVGVMRGEMF